jgi:type II restriction enzyme
MYKIEIIILFLLYFRLIHTFITHNRFKIFKIMSNPELITKSDGLRTRLATMHGGGQHLNDDSKESESVLQSALKGVLEYANTMASNRGWKIAYKSKMDLYEMQCILQKASDGDCPEPDPANRRVFMKPDGGIICAIIGDYTIPILITEDKKQGTNDSRFAEGKGRQATGNAVERGIKNIRAAEMLFHGGKVFPYVLFGSGCDFHPSETIAKRLEIGNYGAKNLEIIKSPNEDIAYDEKLQSLLQQINIQKRYGGKSIATICIKSHKWDEMVHNASAWTQNEIMLICIRVIDLAFADLDERFSKK